MKTAGDLQHLALADHKPPAMDEHIEEEMQSTGPLVERCRNVVEALLDRNLKRFRGPKLPQWPSSTRGLVYWLLGLQPNLYSFLKIRMGFKEQTRPQSCDRLTPLN
jgi:hypothetical protein